MSDLNTAAPPISNGESFKEEPPVVKKPALITPLPPGAENKPGGERDPAKPVEPNSGG